MAHPADQIAAANIAGYIASLQERRSDAVDAGRRGVQLAWDRHAHLSLAMALFYLPYALLRIGDVEAAAQLMALCGATDSGSTRGRPPTRQYP